MAGEVAKELEARGFSTAVINPRSVKPLDIDTISFFARSADVVVTMEDHVLAGGFGSAVLEELSAHGLQTPVVRIGWPDAFIEHGKPDALRTKYGISVAATVEKTLPYLKKNKAAAKTDRRLSLNRKLAQTTCCLGARRAQENAVDSRVRNHPAGTWKLGLHLHASASC